MLHMCHYEAEMRTRVMLQRLPTTLNMVYKGKVVVRDRVSGGRLDDETT